MSSLPSTTATKNPFKEALVRAYRKQHGKCNTPKCNADLSIGYEFEVASDGTPILVCKDCAQAGVKAS